LPKRIQFHGKGSDQLGDTSVELVHVQLDLKHNFVMIARGPVGPKYPKDTVWKLHNFSAACQALIGSSRTTAEVDRTVTMMVLPGHGFAKHLVKDGNQIAMKHIFPSSIRNSTTLPDLLGFAKRLPALLKYLQPGTRSIEKDQVWKPISYSARLCRYRQAQSQSSQ